MELTRNHKLIIGIASVCILAYATKNYWMPKKKTTSTTSTTPKTGVISTQSAPTSTSTISKRDSMIAEIKKQSLEADPSAEKVADDFYKDFTDRELEVILIFGKMNKDGASKNPPKSESEAKQLLAKYGTNPEELGKVMAKMLENTFKK